MGKTRGLFKTISDTKRTFHAKMGTKRQKWYGPNRAEDIKKTWQHYTEELYKRDLNDTDNHESVINLCVIASTVHELRTSRCSSWV